jgi:hypothetical protein
VVVDHVRRCLELGPEVEPDHGAARTAKWHRKQVRVRQGVTYDQRRARVLAAKEIREAALVKNHPPDLINVPLPATARTRIAAWLDHRGRQPGPLWIGQRGPLTNSGLTQVVLAVGRAAGIKGLRPHRLRQTFATRLHQGGANPAQVQALLGHASLDTSARYFRAGSAENAAVVERVFDR